ncbi:MAG: TraB/GumN family protein [Acetobacteraceae bacterium]|nr:TraB/GumN family protein [Acetobacteraceae bacterium]
MRTLVVLSIIHSEVDLGSAAAAARSRYGEAAWARHQQEVRARWRQMARDLGRLELDWRRVKVYHDSLPEGGEAGLRVVRALAARGSPDYRLVEALVRRGAELVATEDPRLLLLELELVRGAERETARPGAGQRGAAGRKRLAQLLLARDRYMAARIAKTLGEGETGVLFVGAAHQVARFLPGDVRVLSLGAR